MSVRTISGLFVGAYALAQGLWILAVRPDPPAGARTATRRFRQVIAIGMAIIGVFLIASNVASI